TCDSIEGAVGASEERTEPQLSPAASRVQTSQGRGAGARSAPPHGLAVMETRTSLAVPLPFAGPSGGEHVSRRSHVGHGKISLASLFFEGGGCRPVRTRAPVQWACAGF